LLWSKKTPLQLQIRIATAVISVEYHANVGMFREFHGWQNEEYVSRAKKRVHHTSSVAAGSCFKVYSIKKFFCVGIKNHSLCQVKDYLEIKNQWYSLIENASN